MALHIDPTANRRPLPLVESPELESLVAPICAGLSPAYGYVAMGSSTVRIALYSDSPHLRQFFTSNWGGTYDANRHTSEATIVALCGDSYTAASQLVPGARFVDPSRRLIASVGNEYYGNIKISVRGLCSSAARIEGYGGFLHGSALAIGDFGVVIGGASGAGKTTTTRALFELLKGRVSVVNDDWGWADHEAQRLLFTGEPHLHMKYRSVRTIAPGLSISPELHASENYDGDPENPHARLLVPRELVFDGAIANEAPFSAYVVLIRDHAAPFFVRPLGSADVSLVEAAAYSAFYQRNERFFDGSLLLLNEDDIDGERRRFRRLLSQMPSIIINNVSAPVETARAVWNHVESLGSRA